MARYPGLLGAPQAGFPGGVLRETLIRCVSAAGGAPLRLPPGPGRLAGLIDFWWHPVEFRSFRAVAQPSENSPYLELSRNEQLIVIAVRKL